MLKKIYTAEFNDSGTSTAAENITKMSLEDRQFLDLMERECSKGNHYKLPLRLRNPDAVFPNNRSMAELRLKNLKKRFIVGILVKFREDCVTIMTDIEAMFYQKFVANQHRSLLNFLWWENGDIKEQPQIYQHCK